MFKKGHDANEVQKEVSSCVSQCFNGFHITSHMLEKTQKVDFESIDIVYKPVKCITKSLSVILRLKLI